MSELRITKVYAEALHATPPELRVTKIFAEALHATPPELRMTKIYAEVLAGEAATLPPPRRLAPVVNIIT